MEAKDKAKALVDSFIETMPPLAHQNGFIIMKYAKQCALIACAEVKNNTLNILIDYSSAVKNEEYWEDVENEINQL